MAQIRPIFYPLAYCDIADPAVWATVLTTISSRSSRFGNPNAIGTAPSDIATTWSAPLVNNASSNTSSNTPGTFTYTTESTILGTVVSSSVGGGTLTGVSYTDPDGVLWTTVDWQWEVLFENYSVYNPGGGGNYSHEWVSWTGDATTARQIGCSANLLTTASVSLVIVFPQAFSSIRTMTWVTTAMIQDGYHAAYSSDPRVATGGVMTFGNASFTVTDDLPHGVSVNELGVVYDALVIADYSGKVCAAGRYAGDGNTARSISVPTLKTLPIDLLFVVGNLGVYAADNLPAGESLGIRQIDTTVFTNGIKAIGTGSFTVGNNNNVNNASLVYYWFAFCRTAAPEITPQFISTFSGAGTGSTVQVTGIGTPGFTSGFTFAREYVVGSTPACRVRSPSGTGTQSYLTDPSSSGLDLTGGIRAVGAGTIDLGTAVLPNAQTTYGIAFRGTAALVVYPAPVWDNCITVDDGNGSTSTICTETLVPPGDHVVGNPLWWCNATTGQSVWQVLSPGAGWAACTGPTSLSGWYWSLTGFGGASVVTSGGSPANPRSWTDIATWATGGRAVLGGSPGAMCVSNNRIFYPATGYTVGTAFPLLRMFDGRKDIQLTQLPPTTTNVVPKAVISMLSANGTIYLTTWDTGTSSADWAGRVFQLDAVTGILTALGTVFASGELPYALAWHMGRLWCGTTNGIGTVGNVYYFRPGQDTAWTSDHTCAQGVDALVSFNGKLYVGVDAAAGARGKVLVRDTAGAYTTSQTGAGGTAAVNNGYLALRVFQNNLYASYYNADAPLVSRIEKFDGTTWTTAYTGVGGTLKPFILLGEDSNLLFAVSGKTGTAATIINTADGTSWTNLSSELPAPEQGLTTLLPMFGAVVL